MDAVIEHYKQHVDRTLLRENMKLTPQQRLERFEGFMADVVELHQAGQRHRKKAEARALDSETATSASE